MAITIEKIIEQMDEMSGADLQSLIDEAGQAFERVRKREMKQALEEMESVASKHGFDISELIAKKSQEMTTRRNGEPGEPVRFKNPKDASQTWTGRGRMPSWLKEVKESGGDIEDFRVSQ